MFKTIRVKLNERVVVFRGALPVRALGPGVHTVWGFGLTEQRWDVTKLTFDALPEVRAVLPASWFSEVTLGSHERGVLYQDQRPKLFLRPGVHRFWTVDESVRLAAFLIEDVMPELTTELASVVPGIEYLEVTVREHERGLLYRRGKFVRLLDPGRYTLWQRPEARYDVTSVDVRSVQSALVGQELMTRDKVSLRLSLTVEYAVVDPAAAIHVAQNVRDSVYLLVQLASRDFVARKDLDELLSGREAMTEFLLAEVAPRALAFGVRVERVGVKDIVLPGEMKTLLNRVIEAEKAAAANVILRREEVAATRQLANTAKVMAENPILLRLKELESLKEIASHVHEVRVVTMADGMASLLPTGWLARDPAAGGSRAARDEPEAS